MTSEEINIYCDESCHLEHDDSNVMVLGAICCPNFDRQRIFKQIREIKKDFGLSETFEIKWTKVGDTKAEFYIKLIEYFFNSKSLNFRGLIIPDKSIVNNEKYNQDWETFYYKMYYYLLRNLINPQCLYNIYIDIKDTKGSEKRKKLLEILNTITKDYLYSKELSVKKLQAVQSKEVELIQLADLIMGAICFENRGLSHNIECNKGKLKVIHSIKESTGYPLTLSTFPNESKFNLFKIDLKGSH